MGNFISKTKRILRLPEPEPVSNFEVFGGWGPPSDRRVTLDPVESEREQRLEGARALAELAERDAERRKAAAEARLAGVPKHARGINYAKGRFE